MINCIWETCKTCDIENCAKWHRDRVTKLFLKCSYRLCCLREKIEAPVLLHLAVCLVQPITFWQFCWCAHFSLIKAAHAWSCPCCFCFSDLSRNTRPLFLALLTATALRGQWGQLQPDLISYAVSCWKSMPQTRPVCTVHLTYVFVLCLRVLLT